MPILLVCPSCGKRLQVGDQYAGRKVACPGCKTVITAPTAGGAAPAPAAPPPAPKPVPPPPPPAPEPEPTGDPFAFGASGGTRDEDEPAPPPARKPGIVGAVGGKPAKSKDEPKAKRRPPAEEDDVPPRPRRSGRGPADEPKQPSAKAWKGFGTGSGMAKWGMWIEFIGFAFGVGLVAYLVLAAIDTPRGAAEKLEDFGGPLVLAPFFLSSLVGTTLVWLGRARMMGIPSGTGAKKVFLGAFLFTLIRFFAVVGAAILVVVAATEWKSSPGDAAARTVMAILIWMAGVPFWLLADLSTIPAMAIVGGAIPSLPLRRRAGWVTFVLQLVVIGYVAVALIVYFGGEGLTLSDLRGGPTTTVRTTGPGGRPGTTVVVPGSRPSVSSVGETAKTAVMASAAIMIVLQLVYTALYASMYGAGARAARDAREVEEAAEDEDI